MWYKFLQFFSLWKRYFEENWPYLQVFNKIHFPKFSCQAPLSEYLSIDGCHKNRVFESLRNVWIFLFENSISQKVMKCTYQKKVYIYLSYKMEWSNNIINLEWICKGIYFMCPILSHFILRLFVMKNIMPSVMKK